MLFASSAALILSPTRELATQIRMRPGDSLLIAGLVRERDSVNKSGPGFKTPILPTSRTAQTSNTELVFLMKPKVIVYTSETPESRKMNPVDLSPSAPQTSQEKYPTGSIAPTALNPAL